MNYDRNLKAGEKIELLVDSMGKPGKYFSKIESIVNKNTFIITRPFGEEEYTYLSLGEVIKIVYFREDGAYYFDAKVIERIKSESSVSAIVTSLSDLYKLQRRNYFRLSIMVPIKIAFMDNLNRIVKHFDTIDISGGGARISSSTKFNAGMDIEVCAKIDGIEDSIIKGKIVRCTVSNKEDGLYETGIEFIDISVEARQAIIKYIFTRQRVLLKRGTISRN